MMGKNIAGNDKRIYDSESSQRDITFINDLQNSKNHDKSFNEQLDEKSKFVLNSNETNASQQHNISTVSMVSNMLRNCKSYSKAGKHNEALDEAVRCIKSLNFSIQLTEN